MPVTITLKNIPDSIYQSLKQSAENNRRSLNMEAITLLEKALTSAQTLSVEECIEHIRRLSATLPAINHHEDPVKIVRRIRNQRTARDKSLVEKTVSARAQKNSSKRKGAA